jgi:hypothetical protein
MKMKELIYNKILENRKKYIQLILLTLSIEWIKTLAQLTSNLD